MERPSHKLATEISRTIRPRSFWTLLRSFRRSVYDPRVSGETGSLFPGGFYCQRALFGPLEQRFLSRAKTWPGKRYRIYVGPIAHDTGRIGRRCRRSFDRWPDQSVDIQTRCRASILLIGRAVALFSGIGP